MESIQKQQSYDIFTSSFSNVEIANDSERAIVIIPLMHVGANSKGLYWTVSMLKKIAPKFRSVPFRYDLEGKEGSSHTLNKLSSPHYDVGWTYSSEEGAWYDDKTKALWVKGEVTHPDVIAKLRRQTSDGKREVNFASMGVIVEESKCSICGSEFLDNACENGHERNKKYPGEGTCYKVPTTISKVLHAALTNDPADGEAEIKNVLFQELGYEAAPADKREQAGEQMERNDLSNQIPGGLAPSSPQTGQPGEAPSSEKILRDLAERIKTIEQKLTVQGENEETPELVNASPQDQFTQSNMGNTTQFEAQNENNTEEKRMDVNQGQTSNGQTPVNPEAADMGSVMAMLQQILAKLSATESADMGKEALSAGKGQAVKAQESIPMEHEGPGDSVSNSEDSGNKKNKAAMTKPDKVENADVSDLTFKTELADLRKEVKELRSKLEIQDNELPEFGSSSTPSRALEVADMGAKGRTENFGEYGAWDAIFNGSSSAQKFKR